MLKKIKKGYFGKRDNALRVLERLRNIIAWPYRKLIFKKIGKRVCISPKAHIWGAHKIILGNDVYIGAGVTLKANSSGVCIEIGNDVFVDNGVMIEAHEGKIRIGSHSSVNAYCVLYGHGGLTIGNYVRIATGVVVIPANHTFKDRNTPIHKQEISAKGITIDDDVWLGTRVCVLDGVAIGKGSVIGAGAVVTKDVPEYCVYAGVPAKLVKER